MATTHRYRWHEMSHKDLVIMRDGDKYERDRSKRYYLLKKRFDKIDEKNRQDIERNKRKAFRRQAMNYTRSFLGKVKRLKPGNCFMIGIGDRIIRVYVEDEAFMIEGYASIPKNRVLWWNRFSPASEFLSILEARFVSLQGDRGAVANLSHSFAKNSWVSPVKED